MLIYTRTIFQVRLNVLIQDSFLILLTFKIYYIFSSSVKKRSSGNFFFLFLPAFLFSLVLKSLKRFSFEITLLVTFFLCCYRLEPHRVASYKQFDKCVPNKNTLSASNIPSKQASLENTQVIALDTTQQTRLALKLL